MEGGSGAPPRGWHTGHPAPRDLLTRLSVDQEEVARFCREHKIRELSLFGSVLRNDFRSDSDVDVLVEFEPDARVTLFDLVSIHEQLSDLFGRKADVVTKRSLSPYIRDRVLASREVLYVRAG